MSKAYRIVFECPRGFHNINVQKKSPKSTLSEAEAKAMFVHEEILCNEPHCGWKGRAARLKLRQIVPFDWIYSPVA
jgi:hypothetical protein